MSSRLCMGRGLTEVFSVLVNGHAKTEFFFKCTQCADNVCT